MGIINSAAGLPLRITYSFCSPFFFIHFFYCGKMNLAISLGLILSAVVVTARIVKPGGETNNYVDKAAAIPEEGDEEIVKTAVAEKKEIKAEMVDEDKKDGAEFEEVDDAKINKVVLRQKCPSGCRAFVDCIPYCEADDTGFLIRQYQAGNCKEACQRKYRIHNSQSPDECIANC